jgi:hypothetical protein
MAADSTALLLRWIHQPHTRPCDLADLLLITAMTGDEWPITGRLVADHLLPRFRHHGIRWVQVVGAGASQADGITVLSDSRQTARVHLDGAYKLSQKCWPPGPFALTSQFWPVGAGITEEGGWAAYLPGVRPVRAAA